MIRLTAGLLLLSLLCGCSLKDGSFLLSPNRLKMYEADRALAKGDENSAVRIMEGISGDPSINEGVTDEALFRLSLLGIRQYSDPDGMKLVRSRLERLQLEYPSSSWSRLSWPLLEYLSESDKYRNDLRNVKMRNSALSRENRELNLANQQVQALIKENRELLQRIEKLKSLDLELERKNRR